MYVCVCPWHPCEFVRVLPSLKLSRKLMLHGQAEGGHMLTKICTNVHANKPFDENRVLTLVLYNIGVCDVDDLVENPICTAGSKWNQQRFSKNIYKQRLWMDRKLEIHLTELIKNLTKPVIALHSV